MPPPDVPQIDVVDSTWLGVAPSAVAPVLADPANWRRWWPDLDLAADELRGPKGVRWTVRSVRGAALAGSMEVWLQPIDGGTVAHYFLRLNGTGHPVPSRERERIVDAHRRRAKRVFWGLGDSLDPGRIARISGPAHTIP